MAELWRSQLGLHFDVGMHGGHVFPTVNIVLIHHGSQTPVNLNAGPVKVFVTHGEEAVTNIVGEGSTARDWLLSRRFHGFQSSSGLVNTLLEGSQNFFFSGDCSLSSSPVLAHTGCWHRPNVIHVLIIINVLPLVRTSRLRGTEVTFFFCNNGLDLQ